MLKDWYGHDECLALPVVMGKPLGAAQKSKKKTVWFRWFSSLKWLVFGVSPPSCSEVSLCWFATFRINPWHWCCLKILDSRAAYSLSRVSPAKGCKTIDLLKLEIFFTNERMDAILHRPSERSSSERDSRPNLWPRHFRATLNPGVTVLGKLVHFQADSQHSPDDTNDSRRTNISSKRHTRTDSPPLWRREFRWCHAGNHHPRGLAQVSARFLENLGCLLVKSALPY